MTETSSGVSSGAGGSPDRQRPVSEARKESILPPASGTRTRWRPPKWGRGGGRIRRRPAADTGWSSTASRRRGRRVCSELRPGSFRHVEGQGRTRGASGGWSARDRGVRELADRRARRYARSRRGARRSGPDPRVGAATSLSDPTPALSPTVAVGCRGCFWSTPDASVGGLSGWLPQPCHHVTNARNNPQSDPGVTCREQGRKRQSSEHFSSDVHERDVNGCCGAENKGFGADLGSGDSPNKRALCPIVGRSVNAWAPVSGPSGPCRAESRKGRSELENFERGRGESSSYNLAVTRT